MIAPALLLCGSLLPLPDHSDIHKCQIGGDTLYQEARPGVEVSMTRGNALTYEAPDLHPYAKCSPGSKITGAAAQLPASNQA
ncbi:MULTISPECIES: hypothetical protein [Halomonadaceae]|uniref:hypothetical protein n=1 Tax=Halomonadaceae TaxID=28256 RepID=UPI0015822086|nr:MULTISPECIES: hypothetical protein [Halomonas]MDI4639179.1 hypothetical protein [Halomonas sp. BMC7]NUJ60169.1 hypothetical protein [Halomonas taeanensis]